MSKVDVVEKHSIDAPALWANTVLDFRGTPYEKDFVVNGTVTTWAKQGAKNRPPKDMTPAESLISTMAGQFEFSAQADEHFAKLIETTPINGNDFYASAYAMLMNGHQAPHYHPAPGTYTEAPLRILTIIPFANTKEFDSKGRKHTQGVEFSMFNLDDPLARLEGGKREIVGEPISPQYKVHFEPGHVGMVVFKGGIHEFKGNGLVLSAHPLDIDPKNIGNTYDANTLTWNGSKDLADQVVLTPHPHNTTHRRKIGYDNLTAFGSAAKNEAIRFVERIAANHNPEDPATRAQIKEYRRLMRDAGTVSIEGGPG